MTTTYAPAEARWLSSDARASIKVESWRSERPLFAVAVVVSAILWVVLTVTIVGIAYAALFGVFFFFMQAIFVAHVRGNGVKLGPDQFPDLYERVQEIGRRMGMNRVPEAYVMQAGGALNAFATRFLRRHIIVLFTDLLEACGEDEAARDMIIGHELGHVHAGHLRWHWFLLPSSIVPFLGPALSRAREFTCDRYGWASAGDPAGAQLGLTILAAGGRYGRSVNREALVRQRYDLATGWMTVGKWLASHPPLANRLLALNPELSDGREPSAAGTLRAAAIVGLLLLPLFLAIWFGGKLFADSFRTGLAGARATAAPTTAPTRTIEQNQALLRELEGSIQNLAAFLQNEAAAGRSLPTDSEELRARWNTAKPSEQFPVDPFDGLQLGYIPTTDGYTLWSTGPDGEAGTGDDLEYKFPRQQ